MVKKNNSKKVLIVFGTRPEAIKMAPVIIELKKKMDVRICSTGQHREMLDQVLNLFGLQPNHDLNIMKDNQDLFDITGNLLLGIKKILIKEKPDLVIVHGDTTTTMTTAMASFYMKIPLGHVEAGLRTHNLNAPFPEEFNRHLTTLVTKFNFVPTENARENLRNENVPEKNIFLTGNSIIDALLSVVIKARKIEFPKKLLKNLPFLKEGQKNIPKTILITGHRRENFGKNFENICKALHEISLIHSDIQIIYPVHPNPNVVKPVKKFLANIKNIHLIEPIDYLHFIKLMDLSYFIITDSGGIQEEAPVLGKPVLLLREVTERPEAVNAGSVKLVGTNKNKIVKNASLLIKDKDYYDKMSKAKNPYGDGKTSKKISKIIEKFFNRIN